jgi:hypothetical protein
MDRIDDTILVLIPRIHATQYQKVVLRGVEAGGIWIESQDLMNEFMQLIGVAGAPRTLAFFVPYASIATMLALMGHMSRAMLERYSHIRMAAKREAVAGVTLRQKLQNSEVVPVKVPVMAQIATIQ